MNKINLIFGIHCHQPVGNFEDVFISAYEKAYKQFFGILKEFPSMKVNLHLSGVLLDWFKEKHPEFLEEIDNLVKAKQVELLTGGYYEPILTSIPQEDINGQIQMLSDFIKTRFNYTPRGMWIPERVWEQDLARILPENNIEYIALDDNHFKMSGLKDEDLKGYFITEKEGKPLKIFPISKKLRYLIPFHSCEEIFSFFREEAIGEENLLVFADDGEKFGLWPNTQIIYQNRYLQRFFSLLEENKSWIRVFTYSEYIDNYPPWGRIYLPSASYPEMMEWALFTEKRKELLKLRKEKKESLNEFIPTGIWNNFLVKYSEANDMHKTMLSISKKIKQNENYLVLENKLTQAKKELYQGQCNCAYWYGLFGGIYLPHLRRAIYNHLIEAENIVDNSIHHNENYFDYSVKDINCDGFPEVIIQTSKLNLYFKPQYGATLYELDWRQKLLNLGANISRREEPYHQFIDLKDIEQKTSFKQSDLKKYLSYDWYRRYSLIDHFFHPQTTIEGLKNSQYGEQGDFINNPYEYRVEKGGDGFRVTFSRVGGVWIEDLFKKIEVIKEINIPQQGNFIEINYILRNMEAEKINLWFGCEFNFSLFLSAGQKQLAKVNQFTLEEIKENAKINFYFSEPFSIWHFPVATIINSESGIEIIPQELSLIIHKQFSLEKQSQAQFRIKLCLQD